MIYFKVNCMVNYILSFNESFGEPFNSLDLKGYFIQIKNGDFMQKGFMEIFGQSFNSLDLKGYFIQIKNGDFMKKEYFYFLSFSQES